MSDASAVQANEENSGKARGLVAITEAPIVPDQMFSQELTVVARDILAAQQVNDRIPALLSKSQTVLHETDELIGICHDVGATVLPSSELLYVAALGTGAVVGSAHTSSDATALVAREIVTTF